MRSLLSQGRACFVLVHLKNGNYLGGRYTADSVASSYPEPQELYLSEVWRIDGQGRFQSKIEATGGVLVKHDMIAYLEFYELGEVSSEQSQSAAMAGDTDSTS